MSIRLVAIGLISKPEVWEPTSSNKRLSVDLKHGPWDFVKTLAGDSPRSRLSSVDTTFSSTICFKSFLCAIAAASILLLSSGNYMFLTYHIAIIGRCSFGCETACTEGARKPAEQHSKGNHPAPIPPTVPCADFVNTCKTVTGLTTTISV